MKLEQQVPSQELCKELKELGYPQESLFWWELDEDENSRVAYDPSPIRDYDFSAPTVAELGEILPAQIVPKIGEPWLVCTKEKGGSWVIFYGKYNDDGYIKSTGVVLHEDTEANARAKMLIYLLENKLITFK